MRSKVSPRALARVLWVELVCTCGHAQENIDIYATKEPQEAFHQRILFCLELYNQSVKVGVVTCCLPGHVTLM